MDKTAQAGMEYLMTYGWALVLIATIMGAIVFVISPPTETASFSSDDTKILLKGGSAVPDRGGLLLQNSTGTIIELTSVKFFGDFGPSGAYTLNNNPVTFPISVPAGSEMAFEGLSSANNCADGGTAVLLYRDGFGFENRANIECNGGAEMPLVWYSFEEESGTMAEDSSGNQNDGTLEPGGSQPLRVTGCPSGKCLQFDGSNYVIKNPVASYPSNAITTSFWMQSSDAANNGSPLSYAVSGSDNHFLLYNYRAFSIFRDASVPTGVSANDGSWHHIMVTWRSSDGETKLFKDGFQAYTGTLPQGTQISSAGSFVLAQEQDSVGGGFSLSQAFYGSMDEVMVFDRALTGFEACSLCNEHAAAVSVTCNC